MNTAADAIRAHVDAIDRWRAEQIPCPRCHARAGDRCRKLGRDWLYFARKQPHHLRVKRARKAVAS